MVIGPGLRTQGDEHETCVGSDSFFTQAGFKSQLFGWHHHTFSRLEPSSRLALGVGELNYIISHAYMRFTLTRTQLPASYVYHVHAPRAYWTPSRRHSRSPWSPRGRQLSIQSCFLEASRRRVDERRTMIFAYLVILRYFLVVVLDI